MTHSVESWDKAKAMFEGGATLSDIQHKTTISMGTVCKKAKKLKWAKGKNAKLIFNEINALTEKEKLNEKELEFHDEEVEKILKFRDQLGDFSDKVIKKATELLAESTDGQGFKAIVEGVDKHSITVGINPRFASPSSTTVNNTNAQQNNGDMRTDKDLDMDIDRVLARVATN